MAKRSRDIEDRESAENNLITLVARAEAAEKRVLELQALLHESESERLSSASLKVRTIEATENGQNQPTRQTIQAFPSVNNSAESSVQEIHRDNLHSKLAENITEAFNAPHADLALRYYKELLTEVVAKPLTVRRIAELMFEKFRTSSPCSALYLFLMTNALGGDLDVAMELVRLCDVLEEEDEEELLIFGDLTINNKYEGSVICGDDEIVPYEINGVYTEGDYYISAKPLAIALLAGRLDLVECILMDKEFRIDILDLKVTVVNRYNNRDTDRHYRDIFELCVDTDTDSGLRLLAAHDEYISYRHGYLLNRAAAHNKLKTLEALIGLGADVNSEYPLHSAAGGDKIEAVKVLLKHGANINAENDGKTALIIACDRCNKVLAELLLVEGANMNAGSGHRPPLRLALGNDWKRLYTKMVSAGADLNYPPESPPLHYAISYESTKKALLLIDNGADINATSLSPIGGIRSPLTPLQLAITLGNLKLVRILLTAGADPLICSTLDECPLLLVGLLEKPTVKSRIFRLLAKIIVQTASQSWLKDLSCIFVNNNTVLHLAAITNDEYAITALAKAGADLNVKNRHRKTAITLAKSRKNYAAMAALESCGVVAHVPKPKAK